MLDRMYVCMMYVCMMYVCMMYVCPNLNRFLERFMKPLAVGLFFVSAVLKDPVSE